MLVLAVMIRVYVPIQEVVWGSNAFSNMNALCHAVSYGLGVILLLTRDGMLVTYPTGFTVALAVILFSLSLFNCMIIQFYGTHVRPTWFVALDKVSYFQVMMLCALTLKCCLFDRGFTDFVLIRESKERESVHRVKSESTANETVNTSLLTPDSDDIPLCLNKSAALNEQS